MDRTQTDGYIVVAGHISLDITPGFHSLGDKTLHEVFHPGKLIEVSDVSLATGGVVSNTGIALKRLGLDTKLIGKVGHDSFGEIVLEILREEGVDEAMSVVEGVNTSYSIVIVPPGIDRMFLHDAGANHTFSYDDIDWSIVEGARLFHLGYPTIMRSLYEDTGRESVRIFKHAKQLGITTSMDMCVPDPDSDAGTVDWEMLLKQLLPFVDIFAPSLEEILFMLDREEYDRLNSIADGRDIIDVLDIKVLKRLGEKILSFGSKVAVIKCGKLGSYIRTKGKKDLLNMGSASPGCLDNWSDRELFEEAYQVPEIASTTGAGDCYIAGFLGAYLKGFCIEETLHIASAVASDCIQTLDAISGIRPLQIMIEEMKSGMNKKHADISNEYWTYSSGILCWVGQHDSYISR